MGRSIFDQLRGKTPQQIADEYADRPDELRQLRDQIAQQVADVRGVTPGSGVDFLDRAAVSFTGTPQGAENVLRQRGYQPVRLQDGSLGVFKDGKVQRVDEQGLGLGDVADLAGDVPATVLGSIGAMAGLAFPIPGGAFTGAAGGSALGEWARQGIGKAMGSGEQIDPAAIAVEGALGAAGEGVGRVIGKVARGPFRRAAEAPRAARRMANIANVDAELGTNLAELAPVSTRADSRFLGNIEAKVRQSPYGGNPLRQQDEVLAQQMEQGFDSIAGKVAPKPAAGAAAATAAQAMPEQVGREVADVAGQVHEARKQAADQLWDNLGQMLPPDTPASTNNTFDAVRSLWQGDIIGRAQKGMKTGTEGIGKLEQALRESQSIKTFADLESQIRAVASEIPWNPALQPVTMSSGVEAGMRKLHAALMADREAFLDVLEAQGAPEVAAASRAARTTWKAMKDLEASPVLKRVFGNELRASEIPSQVAKMTPEEVRNLKQIIGAADVRDVFQATPEGATAWHKIAASIMDDLKVAAENVKESDTYGDVYVLSGDKLKSALRRYKPGVLNEILGEDVTQQLVRFADAARDVTIPQRFLSNTSNTAVMTGSPLEDVAGVATNPMGTLASIGAKTASIFGAGKLVSSPGGRDLLLGAKPWQKATVGGVNLLGALGQVGGQAGVRAVHRTIAPRQR